MSIRPLKKNSPYKEIIDENLSDEYSHGEWKRSDYFSGAGLRSGLQIQKQEILKNPLKVFTSSIFVREIDRTDDEVVAIAPRSHKYSALLNGGLCAGTTVAAFTVATAPVVLGLAGYFGLKTVSHACAGGMMKHNAGFKGYKRELSSLKKRHSLTHP